MQLDELQRQEERAYAEVRRLEAEYNAAMELWGEIWTQIREKVSVLDTQIN